MHYKEVQNPEPQAGEALVKVYAAALNHRDAWIRKGQYAGIQVPIILGSDGAGEVAAMGEGAVLSGAFSEGGPKHCIINPNMGWGNSAKAQAKTYKILGLPANGTFAEYVCVPAVNCLPIPAHLNMAQAAALPLAGLTAYRALFGRAKLEKGDRVLVTGAGGGVALMAVQLALAAGAEVYCTSGSKDKIEKIVHLGAKGGVDYHSETWDKELLAAVPQGFDVIVDSAGGPAFAKFVDLAAPGGRIVFYGGTLGPIPSLSPQRIFWKQLSILGTTMGSDEEFLEMVQFVEKHQVLPIVDSIFALSEGELAMQRMEKGEQLGKIVLEVAK